MRVTQESLTSWRYDSPMNAKKLEKANEMMQEIQYTVQQVIQRFMQLAGNRLD